MTELYSYKGAYPYPLPTDMSDYNTSDFILAPAKPTTVAGEVIEWNGINWVVRAANEAEVAIQWQAVRNTRAVLLQESDVLVIRYTEEGLPVTDAVKQYRQSLRDITSQPDPFNITWPEKPVIS
jgi:hypothetical protein